jgi:hypothetical protein
MNVDGQRQVGSQMKINKSRESQESDGYGFETLPTSNRLVWLMFSCVLLTIETIESTRGICRYLCASSPSEVFKLAMSSFDIAAEISMGTYADIDVTLFDE